MPVTSTAFQKSAFQNNAFQIATASTTAVDTHDGFRKHKPKPHRIFLPEYFSNKKEIPPVLPEKYQYEPEELKEEAIKASPSLLKYDIDWDLVRQYATQESIKLSTVVAQFELAMLEYERKLRDDNDLMMFALMIAHTLH